jgi:hypothetical protein
MFLHLRFILFANFIITEREKHVSFCGFFNLHHYTDITKTAQKTVQKQRKRPAQVDGAGNGVITAQKRA